MRHGPSSASKAASAAIVLLRCVASELGTKLCHLGLGVAIGVVISVAFLVTGPELLRGVHLLGSEPPAVGEIEVIDRVARHAKAGEPLDSPQPPSPRTSATKRRYSHTLMSPQSGARCGR